MKELQNFKNDEIGIVKEIRKDIAHIGSDRWIPGLALYEYNTTDCTLRVAKVETVITVDGKSSSKSLECITKEGCVYLQALNKRTAVKKIRREYSAPLIFDGETLKVL